MSGTDPLAIPGIPSLRLQQLQALFSKQPALDAVWLFGSRAMGRHHNGSDIDLCLEGTGLNHQGRLRLMAEVDELLMPWSVDLVLRHELPAELEAHLQRVGRCRWRAVRTPSVLGLGWRLDAGALYPEPEQQQRE